MILAIWIRLVNFQQDIERLKEMWESEIKNKWRIEEKIGEESSILLAQVTCADQKAQTAYPTSSTSIIPFSNVASTVATTAKKADKRNRARAIIMVVRLESKNEALRLCLHASKSATRKATSRHSDEAESHAASKKQENKTLSTLELEKKQTVVAKQRGLAGTSLSSAVHQWSPNGTPLHPPNSKPRS